MAEHVPPPGAETFVGVCSVCGAPVEWAAIEPPLTGGELVCGDCPPPSKVADAFLLSLAGVVAWLILAAVAVAVLWR